MRKLILTLIPILLQLLIHFPQTSAQSNPKWKYRVLRSPHFEIIYRDEQKDLAKRYVLAAEQAHELLFPVFKEGPHKTVIFLKDDTDNSNGLANFLPYPHITVYPVLPSTLDSIDDYGDWPLEIMVHEYTHILNMYPAHGFYVPLKWIFGSVVRPNALLPKWYLEGLAVGLESVFTDHGRLRSVETQAAARALVLGKRFQLEDVSTINEDSITTWPYGSRPYLFGGWWWENVHREKGVSVIETWNQNFSRRLPYMINGPMEEQTSKTADALLRHTADQLELQAKAEIKQIQESKPHVSFPLTDEKGEQSVFALNPSGTKLVYLVARPGSGSEVRLKIRNKASQSFTDIASQRVFKSVGTTRVRWFDDDSFIYDQADLKAPYHTYRDIYRYDLKNEKRERLTNGERAQEPCPSPSGKFVAYIQNDGGKNRLNLLNLETHESRVLVRGNFNQRLSWPEFLSEDKILFVARQRAGTEKLHLYDVKSGKTTVWNNELGAAQNPRLTPLGVLVTDGSKRVRNVYLAKPDGATAVSNTLTDIQTVDYDHQRKELLVGELTSEGRRLRGIAYAPQTPPLLKGNRIPPAPKPQTTKVSLKEESYQPIYYLWPRYWIPFVYQVEDGFIYQGLTSNQDPAGRNQYSLMASYDTVTQEPSYGISYANHSLPTSIGLGYAKAVSYLGASGLTLESQDALLSFAQYWPFNTRHFRWTLSGLWSDTDGVVADYKRIGPELAMRYSSMDYTLNERWGTHLELSHQEYLEQNGYLSYGRSYLGSAVSLQVGGKHRILWQGRGAVAPEMPFYAIIDLGERNVGGNYLVNLANSTMLLRGYPSGTFVGRKAINSNLEYILPVTAVERGFGTFPLFLRDLELAFFVDTMAVDGAAFDSSLRSYRRKGLSEYFWGAGSELRLNTTTGYHLPLSVTLGLYYGFADKYGGGFTPFFGVGFGGLDPLENKKP
jgi:hypothetical protein